MKHTRAILFISAIVLLCGQAVIAQSCTTSAECTATVRPICVSGACAACTAGSPSACDERDYLNPICNTETGSCGACTDGTQCNFDPTRPICLTTGEFIGCYECANQTNECFNRTMGSSPFCHSDGSCGGCASDFDCLMLYRSNAFVCNSDGVCEVPIVGPYMIATFVIIGFVILVFIIVISVVAAKNKKNRLKRKNRDAAKSDRKLESQPLRSAEASEDLAPRKSVDKPRAVAIQEGDKENLMTGAVVANNTNAKQSKSSSASPDSSSTSESEVTKPVAPVAAIPMVTPATNVERSGSSSVSGRSRSSSSSSSSSSSTTADKKEVESSSGSSVSSSK